MSTHPIPDRAGVNAYTDDPEFAPLLRLYLGEALAQHLAPHLHTLGQRVGGELDALAHTADTHPPVLHSRNRQGMDVQSIEKHPAYQALEQVAFGDYGLAAMSHRPGVLGWPQPLPPAAKYALSYLLVQAEFGLCCPLSMTDSLTRTLRKFGHPDLVARYLSDLTTQDLNRLTQGAMFMTEQGAGSDVAATETLATPDPDSGPGVYRLSGDKWFCSNPDAGLAMVLARVAGAPAGMKGVSLFLLPRNLPNGQANHYRIVRLKDKLGTRSMASGEIRFDGAQAWLVGELGRGFVQMADMVNNSRLSNGMRAAGLMRRAVAEAMFIARERQAFGQRLVAMPLMQVQLAKMWVRAEQARTVMLQAAKALQRADSGDTSAYALTRLLTPLLKYRATRDARKVTADAMEVRGGCGYIEEWADPRLVRDAHLGSIWEGTSNIVALDVLRAIEREGALSVWQAHLRELIEHTPWHARVRPLLEDTLLRVTHLAQTASDNHDAAQARRVGAGLYHLTAAVGMGWESHQVQSPRRMVLAQLVLQHRLLPRDPLAPNTVAHLAPLWEQGQSLGPVDKICVL
jgi:acyl-CoA dehydrogenase